MSNSERSVAAFGTLADAAPFSRIVPVLSVWDEVVRRVRNAIDHIEIDADLEESDCRQKAGRFRA